MQSLNERDSKLVQYLVEAHGKELELEQTLESHIQMTSKMPYKKRLRSHLTETRDHARSLERRVKQLGGGGQLNGAMHAIQQVAGKAVAVAKAPVHVIRGADDQETMLKNAKTEYFNEAEEIATYTAIEALAEKAGDPETARLAKQIRRDEERMQKFLEGQIATLAKAVAIEQIPTRQRNNGSSRSRGASRSRSASAGRGGGRTRTTTSRSSGRSTGQRQAA